MLNFMTMQRSKGAAVALFAWCFLVGCVGISGLSGGTDQAPPGGETTPDGGRDGAGTDGPANAASTSLTITRSGSGKGNVASQDLGVDCGQTCTHVYGSGTVVTLSATPLAGSAFIGWGAPCAGTGACAVAITTNVRVDAAFGLQVLDIDGNRAYEAMDDATLISRYLFGQTDQSLTDGAIGANATRSDPAVVLAYLNSIRAQLDVDGNGQPDALTDGIMIQRYMSGTRGDALTKNAIGSGATRTTSAQVEAYLKMLTP